MRARDVRAIAFCAVSTILLLAVCYLVTRNYLASVGLTGAYAAVILTRPRMQRVFRRLRGDPDWSGYYQNDNRTNFRSGPLGREDRRARRN
jgi:hypothetical protein